MDTLDNGSAASVLPIDVDRFYNDHDYSRDIMLGNSVAELPIGMMMYNSAEAQKVRDFQLYSDNTKYQRAMTDLQAAGLNPLLAAKYGTSGLVGSAASYSGFESSSQKNYNTSRSALARQDIIASKHGIVQGYINAFSGVLKGIAEIGKVFTGAGKK